MDWSFMTDERLHTVTQNAVIWLLGWLRVKCAGGTSSAESKYTLNNAATLSVSVKETLETWLHKQLTRI